MGAEPSKIPLTVSDHAVLRYLERAMDLNVEVVREHILALCSAPAAFGAVCVRADGVRFEICNGRVATVTPDQQTPNRTSRALSQRKIAKASA